MWRLALELLLARVCSWVVEPALLLGELSVRLLARLLLMGPILLQLVALGLLFQMMNKIQ
jgi:hypothetical protein